MIPIIKAKWNITDDTPVNNITQLKRKVNEIKETSRLAQIEENRLKHEQEQSRKRKEMDDFEEMNVQGKRDFRKRKLLNFIQQINPTWVETDIVQLNSFKKFMKG